MHHHLIWLRTQSLLQLLQSMLYNRLYHER
uniref:Uncharacterized protein n=1 Tax=Rhizophora mucronata TaxID=61149 RepID=A0A2P2J5T6_RHIMU